MVNIKGLIAYLLFTLILATSATPNLAIYLLTDDGTVISKGEGFFICENAIMTAKHVVYSGIDFTSKIKAKYHHSEEFQYEVTGILSEYDDYDVAILSVKSLIGPSNTNGEVAIPVVGGDFPEDGIIKDDDEKPSTKVEIDKQSTALAKQHRSSLVNVSSDIGIGLDVFMKGTLNEEQWKTCACVGGIHDDYKLFTMRVMSNIVGFSGTPVLNSNSEVIGMLLNGSVSAGIQGISCYAITMCYLITEILSEFINEIEITENGTIILPPNDADSLVQLNHQSRKIKIDLCHPENSDVKSIREGLVYLCQILDQKEPIEFEEWIVNSRQPLFNLVHSLKIKPIKNTIILCLHQAHMLLVYLTNISIQTIFNTLSIIVVSLFIWTRLIGKIR